MLSLPSSVRVYAALGATDMRKSYDTLAEEVRRVIEECRAVRKSYRYSGGSMMAQRGVEVRSPR